MSVALSSGGGNYTSIVTRSVAKAQCRVDGSDEDTLIDLFIDAAGERAEDVTKKQLYTATRVLRMDGWFDPRYRRDHDENIYIPFPPLQSVGSIVYTDTEGTTQTWNATNYVVDTNSVEGRVRPAHNVSLPTLRDDINDSVKITFDCGYGTNVTNVPTSIRLGMLMQIGTQYKFREDVISGTIIASLPDNATAMSLWSQESVVSVV